MSFRIPLRLFLVPLFLCLAIAPAAASDSKNTPSTAFPGGPGLQIDLLPQPPGAAERPACDDTAASTCIFGRPLPEPRSVPSGSAVQPAPRQPLIAQNRSFIPVALQHYDRTPGVAGRVTLQGGPQGGILLNLMSWDGSTLTTVMTTTTGSDGRYRFASVATLASGQYYYAAFYDNQNGASYDYLAFYRTPLFTGFTYGDHTDLGLMEIANLSPRDPYGFQKVGFPYTFTWWNRPYSSGDILTLNLHKSDATLLYQTAGLGNINSAALAKLPDGAAYGENYLWRIQVYRPDGGTGWGWSSPVAFGYGAIQPGIQGKVTANGQPVSGMQIWLLVQHDDGVWYTDYNLTTQADGSYRFDTPAFINGRPFYVMYRNGSGWSTYNHAYLRSWTSYYLYYFKSGTAVSAGSFDIGSLGTVTPYPAEIRPLPVVFQWLARPSSPSDSYQIQFCDVDCTVDAETDLLGYVSSYTLSSLPPGFYANNTSYFWRIWISDPWGGWGRTFDPLIQFSSTTPTAGIQGRVTNRGVAAAGINLQLRYWDGSQYVISKQVKVESDGSYRFTAVNPIAGEQYHVRFLNSSSGGNTQNTSYLWQWHSYDTGYTSGGSYAGGDFDIADVTLASPADNIVTTLPVTLTWTRRAATLGDSYAAGFEDDPWTNTWQTSEVGYADRVTVSSLGGGMTFAQKYYWFVFVNGAWGDYGVSFNYRGITFISDGSLQAPQPTALHPAVQYRTGYEPAPAPDAQAIKSRQ